MISTCVFGVLSLFLVSIFASKNVEGTLPVLQRTVETLFKDRSDIKYPGTCKILNPTTHQSRMCKREPGLTKVIQTSKYTAVESCEDIFKYDRWNCSLTYNKKANRSIFKKIFRETAFIYSLTAASVAHSVAKGCASGDLTRCSCKTNFGNSSWKMNGCGDDFKYGKMITRNFLDFKHAGSDQIANVLKQDIVIGINSIGEQLREVCKCHGFSGSCTTKTCWKRLGPFSSVMGLLKKHFHHAVKKKIMNYTTKRAIDPKVRKRLNNDKRSLVYLHRTPNLCNTKGRECRDRDNCATLCCGRGFVTSKRAVSSRCRCKMVSCCFVKCETCVQDVEFFTCK